MNSRITAPIKASMMAPMRPPPITMPSLRQQPAGDEGADDADDDIADQPEAAAFHDHAGQPAGDGADNQPNDKALYVHDLTPQIPFPARAEVAV